MRFVGNMLAFGAPLWPLPLATNGVEVLKKFSIRKKFFKEFYMKRTHHPTIQNLAPKLTHLSVSIDVAPPMAS